MGPSSARTIQGAMRGHKARNTVRARENEIIQYQPAQLFGGTRSGAAFTATEAQLWAPSRMELQRERNPELTLLRGQLSDYKRGKLQLSDTTKSAIETRIQQLVEINKALKTKGQGPKLGRPKGT